jgi:hypothetical protein
MSKLLDYHIPEREGEYETVWELWRKKARALSAELVEKIEYTWGDIPEDVLDLLDRVSTALAHPEPEGPTMPAAISDMPEQQQRWYALGWRAALSRYYRPTIKPVPVAERLPGPEDCDERGRCWWLTLAIAEGGRGGYSTFWELTTFEAAVRCASHWLPHHALPAPQP